MVDRVRTKQVNWWFGEQGKVEKTGRENGEWKETRGGRTNAKQV